MPIHNWQLAQYIEFSHEFHSFLVLEQGIPEEHELVMAVKTAGAFAASILEHNSNNQQPED